MNGIRDAELEWVIPNVEIRLADAAEPTIPIATTTTDEKGFFAFNELQAATYAISQATVFTEYVNMNITVGELFDSHSGAPVNAPAGEVVNYDPDNDVLPQITQIEVPNVQVKGVEYNFGQIWLGKFLYLARGQDPGDPPHAVPPPDPIPEPGTPILLIVGSLAVGTLRWRRRRRLRT